MKHNAPRHEVPKQAVDISQFVKLRALFERHGWPIEEDSEISVYSKYYKTLLTLNKEQQDFLIELSDRFLLISMEEYLDRLIEPLRQLRADTCNDNLIFIPCLPEEDAGKIKSATAVLYQLKGSRIKTKIHLGHYFVPESINVEFLQNYADLDNYRFVLVDDFIGTGETAVKAVEYIHKLAPFLVDSSRIIALSIVAMKRGIDALDSIGVKTYYSSVLYRAISDYYHEDELAHATQMMAEIETTIKRLKPEYRFGYQQSEALVCMERCPNNTFPIYWKTAKIAPYER